MIGSFFKYNIYEDNKKEFENEITEINFIRSRNLSLLLLVIFFVLFFTDYLKYSDGLWENFGYKYLFYSHFFYVMALMLLYGFLFVIKLRFNTITINVKKYYVIIFSIILLFGASLTSIADQYIHGEITIYVLCLLLLAVINYQKPLINLVLYAVCHIFFLFGVTYAQPNPVILAAHYFNGTVLVILAIFVSRILFIAKVRDFNSRKTIEHQNRELEQKNLELSAANDELQDSLRALDESQNIIFSLTLALESKDRNTHGHSKRVAYYALALARHFELAEKDILNLWRAAILHDIGKIGIPDAILNKPAPLTEEEWDIIKTHPARGEFICSKLKFAYEILPIIRHHHERYDGKGYPDGLAGDDIPFLARVVSLADTVDAITSSRTYRLHSMTMEEAVQEIKNNSGTQFDPLLVDTFVKLYENDELILSDDELDDLYDID